MKNYIKEKLILNEVVFGIWSIIPSPVLTEIVATADFDFQIFDLEHGLYDIGSLDHAIRSCETSSCSAVVRLGDLNLASAQKALDIGAHGILFPQIKDEADARRATEICKYPPNGSRGYNPFTRANAFGFSNNSLLNRDNTGFAMTGVIIENTTAYSNLDTILQNKDLDFIYLGAYDMSVSLGCAGDMKNPELLKFLNSSIKKIRNAGKIAGVMASNPEDLVMYTDLGANLIVVGVDTYLIGHSMKNLLRVLTNSIKK